MKFKCVVVLLMALACVASAVDPLYQADTPLPGQYLATGEADLNGPGGKAFVEYWVWDGGNDYFYYTYQIHNDDPNEQFNPYIKHLTISNPTGEPYIVTSNSGGYLYDKVTKSQEWDNATYESLPTLVDWVAPSWQGPGSNTESYVFPGISSWGDQKFQFISELPPSMAGLTVRQGDLATYASGLIAAPGMATAMAPRSSGYWKHQSGTKGKRKEAASMPDYLQIIGPASDVFVGLCCAPDAYIILKPDNSSDMSLKVKEQLLALWLNVISGKLGYNAEIEIKDPENVVLTIVVSDVINSAEAALLDPAATLEELEYQKDLVEILNLL